MRAVNVTGVVGSDHTLTVHLPADIPPGARTVVVVLEDAPEVPQAAVSLQFCPHPVGPADPTSTYRREEIYGDDGR